ncbi:hypothetical protein D5F01_LYC14707 [Larimichthys crocea]|uniref:ZP domain-containing protein n=1 Tax=Larimichthys crocea TaxID=215358 RepID=A0A6G0I5E9_LARCR|nr:hypothetical protein D5F01_LYC14707 [Larimichthys crocea]
MGRLVELGWFILLMAVVNIEAQKKPSINIGSQCLGNIMRVNVGPLGGNLLEVAVVINNSAILLTPSLASQCGFSMKIDQLGNAMIYASLQNCFAQNVEDKVFTTTLNLRLHGNQMVEDELYQVAETCQYTTWASREIVCDRSYMEVSRNGYGITNTATRLVLRSPKASPETYIQNVAEVPMTVLRTSVIFEKKWLATQIDAAIACPTLEGSVSFTLNTITWFLPRHIDPLIYSGQFKLLEVHMGVDGQRLEPPEIAARRYSLTVNDVYIIVEIPIGAVGRLL